MAKVAQQTRSPDAKDIGKVFVDKYYSMLPTSPEKLHRFYKDNSKIGRPENDGSMSITTTKRAIKEKIISLNYREFLPEISLVDVQESFNGGIHLLVTGNLVGKDKKVRFFYQTILLAPQENGYYVLNDMMRYMDNVSQNQVSSINVVTPTTPDPTAAPVSQNLTESKDDASMKEVDDLVLDEDWLILEEGDAVQEAYNGMQQYYNKKKNV